MPFHAIGQRLCRRINSAQSRNLRHAVTPSASELAAKALPKRTAAANVTQLGIATTGGIFKKTEVERQPQMQEAKEGPPAIEE
jgi:hypothetical protein